MCIRDRLRAALRFYYGSAGEPKLNTGKRMDRIVNALVAAVITACQPAVCGVHDPISLQGGDIAPPQVQAFLHRRQRMKGGDALAGGYFLQQAVLPVSYTHLPLIVFLGSPFRRTRGKLERFAHKSPLLCCKVCARPA